MLLFPCRAILLPVVPVPPDVFRAGSH